MAILVGFIFYSVLIIIKDRVDLEEEMRAQENRKKRGD